MEGRAELLAPAGNWPCLRAAVANGADAVYFGVESFNARARAENFTTAGLPEIMRYLRLRGVKGYLTFNVLVFADELARAAEILTAASGAGVDAVLVQDLGLARLARALAPDLPLHASTQMTVTSPRTMALLRGRGLARFVLPREFSVDDIARVHAAAPGDEIEAFVHGALCVAYSGQCLTSESLGGRSANRGECAQACRQPYELVADGKPVDLGLRRYLLSPQDLAGIEYLPQLLAAGVVSFKIEGRLKTPEYVANVTRHYRTALDQALAGSAVHLARTDWDELAQSFSRGLTPGYLAGVNHQALVEGAFPKSRGLACGTVTAVKAPWVSVQGCDVALKPGDGIVFDNGDPERKEPGGPVYEVRAEGGTLRVALAHEFPFAAVRPGDRVWRTSDPELNARLRASFAADHRSRPVHFKVTGRPGEPLHLTASCDGVTVQVETGEALVPATGAGLDAEVLAEKFGALGGTPFFLQTCAVSLGAPAALPVSALKRLRRAAVDALTAALEAPPARRLDPEALTELRPAVAKAPPKPGTPELAVFCRSEAQIRAACAAGVARVYADFEDPRGFRDSVAVARTAGVPIYLATPRIEKPGEEGFFRKLAGYAPDGVLVRNLGGLLYFQEKNPELDLIGDFSLNCANDLTARELWALGLRLVTPSYDLNAAQLEALLTNADPARFEVVLHQHMPMFHMEHCVFAAFLSNGKDYRDCGRPCERHDVALRDHTGNLLPVKADVGCRNTVFNGHAQSGALYLDRFRELGVARYRVEFLTEDEGRVREILAIYRELLAGRRPAKDVWSSLRATQRLGVTRGTLDHA